MVKNNALRGILFLVCCFGFANASQHATAGNKSGSKVPAKIGPPPARPPKPSAQSAANAGSSRSVAIAIAGSAASGSDSKQKHELTTLKPTPKGGQAPIATAAQLDLHYQQSDRGLMQLTNKADDEEGGDSGDDVEAQLLPNVRGSGSLKMSHADMAKQLAAKFPNLFSSAAEIEKHVIELAEKNPLIHETMAGYLSGDAGDKSNSELSTPTRKAGKAKKQKSNAAERFLSKQMMEFMKKDRDTHVANATLQTINSKWWKKTTMWSGASSFVGLLLWGYLEYTKEISCKK
jgi:hypothetical protein